MAVFLMCHSGWLLLRNAQSRLLFKPAIHDPWSIRYAFTHIVSLQANALLAHYRGVAVDSGQSYVEHVEPMAGHTADHACGPRLHSERAGRRILCMEPEVCARSNFEETGLTPTAKFGRESEFSISYKLIEELNHVADIA